MTGVATSGRGRAFGASAIGASHLRDGRPNQDAVGWEAQGAWILIAIADGHGGGPHYRSDRGARLAVAALLAQFRGVTRDGAGGEAEALAAEVPGFADALVARWREAVAADMAAEPLPRPAEFGGLSAYGSTCLGVAIGPSATLWLQIGDGDLFAAAPSGEIDRLFEPDDHPGEETDSLCLPGAAARAKVALFAPPHRFAAPDMVLVATDGVTKSFAEPRELVETVSAFRDAVRARGLDAVADDLPHWLAACARGTRQDDATLALFAATPVPPTPPVDAGDRS